MISLTPLRSQTTYDALNVHRSSTMPDFRSVSLSLAFPLPFSPAFSVTLPLARFHRSACPLGSSLVSSMKAIRSGGIAEEDPSGGEG